jgi:hypothetical protein
MSDFDFSDSDASMDGYHECRCFMSGCMGCPGGFDVVSDRTHLLYTRL